MLLENGYSLHVSRIYRLSQGKYIIIGGFVKGFA